MRHPIIGGPPESNLKVLFEERSAFTLILPTKHISVILHILQLQGGSSDEWNLEGLVQGPEDPSQWQSFTAKYCNGTGHIDFGD